ncbi:phage tail protein [Neptuniibacter sp.]|uniref:phage tail protein n=1 Tax=Neptuniibacter sp. TaxID=1962643 RepID=UPI003B5B392D
MGGKSSEATVGFKYYAGVFFKLCFGPIDKIVKMSYADRVCWGGAETGIDNSYGKMVVDNPSLLGGDEREGGISGTIDVGMGYPDQPINDYLQSKQGELVPAHRGIVGLIARHLYWGNNPYPKAPAWLCQRIHIAHDGATQWYDSKAEIGTFDENYTVDLTGQLSEYTVEAGNLSQAADASTPYGNGIAMTATPVGGAALTISKAVTIEDFTHIKFRFMVSTLGSDDAGRFIIRNELGDNVISVTIGRQADIDSSRRVHINPGSGSQGIVISDGPPVLGEWYQVEIQFQPYSSNVDIYLFDSNGDLEGYHLTGYTDLHDVSGFALIQDTDSSPYGVCTFTDIRLAHVIQTGDINPAHFIREIYTNPIWGGGFPDTEMGQTYTDVADTLYAEGLGVSFFFDQEISYGDMIEEVIRTIDAVTYEDPATGLQEIKLIRPDYDAETLPLFDESNSELKELSRTEDHELFNQVIIKYLDNNTRSWQALTFQDAAAIDMSGGRINSKTIEYAGISRPDVATMVGQRDLARFSRPYHKGRRLKLNMAAYAIKPGDAFKLSSPRHGITEMVCRVMKRHPGSWLNKTVEIDWVEDIFGVPYNTYAVPVESGWVDPVQPATDFVHQTAFEVPYFLHIKRLGDSGMQFLDDDSCLYALAGARPENGVMLSYDLYSYADGGVQLPDKEIAATSYFTPYAVVSVDVDDPKVTDIPVSLLVDVDTVRVGHLVLIGNNADDQREIAAVSTSVSDGDTTLKLTRAVSDTVPKAIAAGTVIYFIGDHYGMTNTEYLPGETVEGYGVPISSLGEFTGPYTYHDLPMMGRLFKPYPPANLTIDGLSFPGNTYQPPNADIVLTWNHRDRILQSDQIIDYFEAADYGPEPSTTYLVEADALDGSLAVISASFFSLNVGLVKTYTFNIETNPPPSGTFFVRLRVITVRDGEASLQGAEVVFSYSSGYQLVENGDYQLVENGDYLMLEN